MIVNKNNNFIKFKKKFDIFDMVNPKKAKNISNGIIKLMSNSNRYNKIKRNMKISFKKDLNFENQFANSYNKIL